MDAHKSIKQHTVDNIISLCESLGIQTTRERAEEVLTKDENWPRFNLRTQILVHEKGKELLGILHRHIVHSTRVSAISDGYSFFKRNTTNNRLDTNLTSLPSYLRKHIIAHEPLVNIDIKNSQPLFLYAILKDDTMIEEAELLHFGELVTSGRLYEYLIEKYDALYGKVKARDQMKRLVFRVLFSKVDKRQPEKVFFRSVFPSIMDFIDRTNHEQNNVLAILLQKREAYCVLDVIMPRLKASGIIPLTIHDSYVCCKREAEYVISTINEVMTELLGIVPSLSQVSLIEEEAEEQQWSLTSDLDASAA